MIRAIHTAVRGRARYTVPGLHGSEALKRRLEFRLGACEGIQEVAASTLTGNVLVRFRHDISVEAVAALLGTVGQLLHAFSCRSHTHSLFSAHPLVVNEGTKGHWQRQLPHTMVAGETSRRYHR